MDQIDFSPIGDLELENTDLYKDQYTQKSFIVGIFDIKEVQHYSTSQRNSAKNTTSGGTDSTCTIAANLLGVNQRVTKSLGTNVIGVDVSNNSYVI